MRKSLIPIVTVVLLSLPWVNFSEPSAGADHGFSITSTGAISFEEKTPTRGDLVLTPGEVLYLTGSHSYHSVVLGRNSSLYLASCTLELEGDGVSSPSIVGSPRVVYVNDSSVNIIGRDGSSLLDDHGDDSTIDLDVGEVFSVSGSDIKMWAGGGYYTYDDGAYYEGLDISGFRFSGGNVTFELNMSRGSLLSFKDTSMDVRSGPGGEAPDGEDVDSDDFHRSGGYTLGGNVSGNVGCGGDVTFRFCGDEYNCTIDGLDMFSYTGSGGPAGNAGSVSWVGDAIFDVPTPAGGYTSGYISDNDDILFPGTVSGDVGSGGDCNFILESENLFLKNVTMDMYGSNGGKAGDGGSCQAYYDGTYTRTRGGGGGGGYAGGFSTRYTGMDGGDVYGRVGSCGFLNVSFNATSYCIMETIQFHLWGRGSGVPGVGGEGGGITETGSLTDGGGGGAGGFSGGAGGYAVDFFITNDGGEGGYVSPRVSSAEDLTLTIDAKYLEARGYFNPDRLHATASGGGVVDGTSGEVYAELDYVGGGPGQGETRTGTDGSYREDIKDPAPVPERPVDGETVRDLSMPFQWSKACGAFYLLAETDYIFRLLSSPDTDDVVSELYPDGRSVMLESDPGDGSYYWTVSCVCGDKRSCWSKPRGFVLDREPPRLDLPESGTWLPQSDPQMRFEAVDNTSGIGEEDVEYRVVPVGESSGNWTPAEISELGGSEYGVQLSLPAVEGDYDVWVRAMDQAGNGPVLGGPVRVRVDGTPPSIGPVFPRGAINLDPVVEFHGVDSGSGLKEEVFLELHSDDGRDLNGTFSFSSDGDGNHTLDEVLIIGDGDWEMYLTMRDMVGNAATSDPVEFLLDRHGPVAELTSGAGDVWMNRSGAVSGSIIDSFSPVESVSIVMDPGNGSEIEAEAELDGDMFSFEIPEGMRTGEHELIVTALDSLGNQGTSGPWNIFYDVDPPVAGLPTAVPGEGNFTLTYYLKDRGGGSLYTEAEILIPGEEGLEIIYETEFTEGNGHHTHSFEEIGDYPVVFARIRPVDRAYNEGNWTEPVRVEIFRPDAGMEALCGNILAPGENASFLLRDPLGIHEESLEYRLISSEPSQWRSPVDVEFDSRGNRWYGNLEYPVSAVVSVDPAGYRTFSVEFRWEDALPMGKTMEVNEDGFVRDLFPPHLEAVVDIVSHCNPVEIEVSAFDRHSILSPSHIGILGNESRFHSDQEPTSVGDWLNGTLLVDVTWGVEEEIVVVASDRYGNAAHVNVTTKANRAPVAVIDLDPDEEIGFGEIVLLRSSSFDPDGDPLKITWMNGNDTLGEGDSIEIEGRGEDLHIRMVVSDGDLISVAHVNITAGDEQGSDQGGGGLITVILILIAVITLAVIMVGGYIAVRRMGLIPADRELSVSGGEESWDDGGEETDKNIKCGICMRTVSDPERSVKCKCGERFHRRCAIREGICPECGREILVPVAR